MHNKSPLVLLHGWGVNQGVWQAIRQPLEKHYRLITPDLPGFGINPQLPQPYNLDTVVDMLAAQIPESSVLGGWSLGGLIAIALANRYPEKVRKLGLIAGTPRFVAADGWPGMSATMLQQFSSALSQNLPLTIERFLAIQAMGSSSARADAKMLKQAILTYPSPQPLAVHAALDILASCDLRDEFRRLSIPVMGCYGKLDSLVPIAVINELQQLQPTAHFTVLPKASHAPFITHPDEFCHWLIQLDEERQ